MSDKEEVELLFEITNPEVFDEYRREGIWQTKKLTKDVYFDNDRFSLFKSGIFVRIRDEKKLQFKFNPTDIIRKRQNELLRQKANIKEFRHVVAREPNFGLPLRQHESKRLNELLQFLHMRELHGEINLAKFLKQNELKEFVIIEKTRIRVIKGPFTYNIDHVKDLGEYVEIECQEPDSSKLESYVAEINAIAKELKLKRRETGYVELFLRKHNYELYRQGLYQLKEDSDN